MLRSASLTALAELELVFTRRRPALANIRNFLVPQYQQALGTAVHATPLISALRAVIPEARIAAAASGFALDVLRGNPHLDRLVATPSPLTDMGGAVRALRAAKFFGGEPYAVLQTTGNERLRIALAAVCSGGHPRIGFTVVPQLLAAPLVYDPQRSQIENNLRVIGLLGRGQDLQALCRADPEFAAPRVYPAAKDQAAARGLLREERLDEARPIAVFITQTSPTQRKSWRADRFRAVAEWLDRDFGMQIVFAGSAAECSEIDKLRNGLPFHTVNLAGRTSILELAALMAQADVALTLDTGPMHLARAVRLPMVVIAPAWSPAVEWLPIGNPRARVLKQADLPSVPSGYIIDEVSIDDVKESLRELLTAYPPRLFTWRA